MDRNRRSLFLQDKYQEEKYFKKMSKLMNLERYINCKIYLKKTKKIHLDIETMIAIKERILLLKEKIILHRNGFWKRKL